MKDKIINAIAGLIIIGFFSLVAWGGSLIRLNIIKSDIRETGIYDAGDWRIIGKVQEKGFVDAED